MSFPKHEDLQAETIRDAQEFFDRYDQAEGNKKEAQKRIAEDLGIDYSRIFRWIYVVQPRLQSDHDEPWPDYDAPKKAADRLQVEHGFKDEREAGWSDAPPEFGDASQSSTGAENGSASTDESSTSETKTAVLVSGKQLADAAGVAASSVTRAAHDQRSCKGEPIGEWAVIEDGRVQHYELPAEEAERLGITDEQTVSVSSQSDTEHKEMTPGKKVEPYGDASETEGSSRNESSEEPSEEADEDKLEEEYEEEENENPFAVDDKYSYIEHQDVYLLDIPSYTELFVWPGPKARELAELYSDFDDDPWTLDMCAREFGFPIHVMEEIKKALNLRHKSPPRLREEFENGDVDDYVQDDLAKLQHSYQEKLEKKTYRKMKRDAKKWHERASEIDKRSKRQSEKLADMSENYDVPSLILPFDHSGDLPRGALFCNWQDIHLGRKRYRGDNDLGTYKKDLLAGADSLFGRAALNAQLDKIYIVVGGDLCHADTYFGETTRGTPQDCVANPTELEEQSEDFMLAAIDKARQALKAHNPDGKVELVPVFGNHDRKTSFSIYRFLYAWYRNVDDVVVPLDYDERVYRQYENWFIASTHGDVSKKQMRKMPRIMMQEARDIFGQTEQMILYTGHLHEEVITVDAGVKQHQAPSPAAPDRFDNRNAYTGQPKVLPGHMLYADCPDDQFMNAGILNKR